MENDILKNANWVELSPLTSEQQRRENFQSFFFGQVMPVSLVVLSLLFFFLKKDLSFSINYPSPNNQELGMGGIVVDDEPFEINVDHLVDTISLVVDSEIDKRTSNWEMQLIAECVLYKYWTNTAGTQSITNYLKDNPLTFQGSWERIGRDTTDSFFNVKRFVQMRIEKGTARPIKNYHHTKINGKILVRGKKRALNYRHIANVWTAVADGKLKYLLDSTLKHDFFEDVNKEKKRQFSQWRKNLKGE